MNAIPYLIAHLRQDTMKECICPGRWTVCETIHVSEDSFEARVLRSSLPVLVTFWAPWCPACRTVVPRLDEIARDYAGRLLVAKVDTDQYPDLATRYGAARIPTLVFISGGQVVHQEIGVVADEMIRQRIDGILECGPLLDDSAKKAHNQ